MSQQGHLFRHSFLQGTVAISQSVHPLGAPVTLHELLITFISLGVSHTPEVQGVDSEAPSCPFPYLHRKSLSVTSCQLCRREGSP